jgi:hypothetical protein
MTLWAEWKGVSRYDDERVGFAGECWGGGTEEGSVYIGKRAGVGWKFLRGSGESSKSGSGAVFCVSVRWRRSGVNASGGGGGSDDGKELKAFRKAG